MPTPLFAQSPDDLLTTDEMLSMSGLAFMEGIRQGSLPHPPISETLNFRVQSVKEGEVAFRGTAEFGALNPLRTVHGGWYGTVLDSCMACAVMTKLPKGWAYTTLEYKINVTRSLPLGVEVEALGCVNHFGRRTAVATGELRGVEDGKLYASGSTTCIVMQMAAPD